MLAETPEKLNPGLPFTKAPNALFDLMARLTGAEFKIVATIARFTYGWHKESDVISLSQFELVTGLSRQGVVGCIAALLEQKIIRRERVGGGYAYSLCFVDNQGEAAPLVHNATVDNQPCDGSPVVNSVDTQKTEDVTVKLLDDSDNQIVENVATLSAINQEVVNSGDPPLRNLALLARRASNAGLDGSGLWALWQGCKARADRPLGFFVYALGKDGKPPATPADKARARQSPTHREFFDVMLGGA